jgi:hypothetical protein
MNAQHDASSFQVVRPPIDIAPCDARELLVDRYVALWSSPRVFYQWSKTPRPTGTVLST